MKKGYFLIVLTFLILSGCSENPDFTGIVAYKSEAKEKFVLVIDQKSKKDVVETNYEEHLHNIIRGSKYKGIIYYLDKGDFKNINEGDKVNVWSEGAEIDTLPPKIKAKKIKVIPKSKET